jgi:uncharacterized protein
MNTQRFKKATEYANKRLEEELSASLVYHALTHTRDEVVLAVETLACLEGIKGKSLNLLLTAAWFHDLGYVESAVYHELVSARIAGEVLPTFGFHKDEVEIVRWAILATALPQYPRTHLEKILMDADLDILGSENFVQRNADLRQELVHFGRHFTDEQWYSSQLAFLQKHEYFTASARELRSVQKKKNIDELAGALQLISQDRQSRVEPAYR